MTLSSKGKYVPNKDCTYKYCRSTLSPLWTLGSCNHLFNLILIWLWLFLISNSFHNTCMSMIHVYIVLVCESFKGCNQRELSKLHTDQQKLVIKMLLEWGEQDHQLPSWVTCHAFWGSISLVQQTSPLWQHLALSVFVLNWLRLLPEVTS